MADKEKIQNAQSKERQKESQGTEKFGCGPGSAGPGPIRVHSHSPENRTGEMNPSAPTEATEGPSTNLADRDAGRAGNLGVSRGEPARGEEKTHEGTIKKPFSEKHEAA